MDRFLFKINVDYPDAEAELGIMKLVRGEEAAPPQVDEPVDPTAIFAARKAIHGIHLSDSVERYLVDLVMATRRPDHLGDKLAGWLDVGSSPRATIGLDKATRAHAWLAGRDHATPDDVRAVVHAVLRHRLILSYDATADGITPDQVIDEILTQVAVA
jgi:MoxR-like ATPase